MKLLIWSSQVPPFWQGCEAHSSTSTKVGRNTKEVEWSNLVKVIR